MISCPLCESEVESVENCGSPDNSVVELTVVDNEVVAAESRSAQKVKFHPCGCEATGAF